MYQKPRIFAKKDTISILFSEELFLIFDYEGRLFLVFDKGRVFRRSFDNVILSSNTLNQEDRYFLNSDKANEILRYYTRLAREVLEKGNYYIHSQYVETNLVKRVIEIIQEMDEKKLEEDGRRFRSIFKPITILPPENYLSLYIPITQGCSYNRCSFCNLYRDRSFRIKSESEVKTELEKIVDFFGSSLLTRRGIFIGEGNVFVEKTKDIIEKIEFIKNFLRGNRYITFDLNDAFYGFMDTFHTRKSIEELEGLKNVGVRKVYIGLESGSDYILSNFLLKPSTSSDVVKTVNNVKKVGMSVGVIVIVGVGGRNYREEHFKKTMEVISQMDVSLGDSIYLSPIVEYQNLEYKSIASKIGIDSMTREEIEEETNRFRNAIIGVKMTKVPVYKVDKFLYS
ncbi:MAG: radical SAM protein [Spirochaetes bacterium]|nr:radical SAM protein [Spirochaetota bacterium]